MARSQVIFGAASIEHQKAGDGDQGLYPQEHREQIAARRGAFGEPRAFWRGRRSQVLSQTTMIAVPPARAFAQGAPLSGSGIKLSGGPPPRWSWQAAGSSGGAPSSPTPPRRPLLHRPAAAPALAAFFGCCFRAAVRVFGGLSQTAGYPRLLLLRARALVPGAICGARAVARAGPTRVLNVHSSCVRPRAANRVSEAL